MRAETVISAGEMIPLDFIADTFTEVEDKPQDHCGVFGIYAPGLPVGRIAYNGGVALEHRGYSGSGMAYWDPTPKSEQVVIYKGLGRLCEAIPEMKPDEFDLTPADRVKAFLAITHTRYGTSEGNDAKDSHPFIGAVTGITVMANGQVNNLDKLASKYGLILTDQTSDTRNLTDIVDVSLSQTGDIKQTLNDVLSEVSGAYCLVMMYQGKLIAARDKKGVHPLSYAKLKKNRGVVFGSEDIALSKTILEEEFESIEDVLPGEVIIYDGIKEDRFSIGDDEKEAFCIYEHIYTADERSVVNGVETRPARVNLGRRLAKNSPVEADIVVGSPNSGIPVAEGYSEASGIPLETGAVIKNPSIYRTFILRGVARALALANKFFVNRAKVAGKRVVLVDDSGIKGNTTRQLAQQLFEAGATEVHVRFGSPPYRNPCNLGMDTGKESELMAAYNRTNEEIAKNLRVNSVGYNTYADVEASINDARVVGVAPLLGKFCAGCSVGDYPYDKPRKEIRAFPLIKELTITHVDKVGVGA